MRGYLVAVAEFIGGALVATFEFICALIVITIIVEFFILLKLFLEYSF